MSVMGEKLTDVQIRNFLQLLIALDDKENFNKALRENSRIRKIWDNCIVQLQ